ncbi:CARDB domain-containing protein [Halorubrum sp. AD140]|uniref:CARDB domain-containing protein n=1 Tax=Halorubrum sp. AD140 TaxID=3050073 RepID=UPI002ACCA65F|nr:CARDB domain-containing protein [Halorubrum sp. AD140]MDZ5812022.1 CARDB domain-containing protein [Halorubrum sp. AD140]
MSTVRRTLALVLLLVAAASLAFATGAAVVDGPADTFADDELAVQPADGPNGDYAYLNDDDEIAVDVSASNPKLGPDFEGVNVGTAGTIDDVFEITYTGDEYARVWIENDGENVTFVADGGSVEGEANNVTLAPNESVAVGLALDTRGEAAGTRLGADEFSINAEGAEAESVEAAGGTGGGGGDGDNDPTTTVRAPGPDEREFTARDVDRGDTIRFGADGMALDGENVTLEGIDLDGVESDSVELDAAGSPDPFENESPLAAPTRPREMAYLALDYDFAPDAVDEMTIRFSADPDRLNATDTEPEDVTLYRQTDAGEWEEKPVEVVDDEVVEILGLPEDRVHFRATTEEFSTFAVAARAPRFDVTEASVAPEAIEPGEAVTVRATMENGGGAAGEETVALTADGDSVANETVATESVALEPNETATVELDGTFEEPGAYDLAVDGTPVGTVVVGDPAGNGDEGESANAESDAARDDDSESGDGPTEEPGGVDPAALVGLPVLVAVVVATLALFRRTPRP